jgi:hypothetical protein
MARMLVLDGEVCLRDIFVEVLESESYAVCKACNNDDGTMHVSQRAHGPDVAHDPVLLLSSPPAGSGGGLLAFPHVTIAHRLLASMIVD